MRNLGESVIRNGVPGVISSPPLFPAGVENYLVREAGESLLSEITWPAADLQDGPPLAEYEVGDVVPLYGSMATITARDGDSYAATIVMPRLSGVVFTHRYPAIPAWRLEIEKWLHAAVTKGRQDD